MAYNRSAIFGRRSRSAVTTLRAPPSKLTHSRPGVVVSPGAVVSPGIFSLRRYPPDDSSGRPISRKVGGMVDDGDRDGEMKRTLRMKQWETVSDDCNQWYMLRGILGRLC